ncbi:hypothetical protein ACS0TY_021669 [Phlomoides rotata]
MGSGFSRPGSGSYTRAGPHQRSCPSLSRSISSILVCGDSSSREGHLPTKQSGLSMNDEDDLISIKAEHVVSPGRCLGAYDNPALEYGVNHVEPCNRGKWLSESRELVPSHQSNDSSRSNGTASSSCRDQPFPYCVSENDDTSQAGEELNNSSSVYYNGLGEPLSDEVSVSEEVDFSHSDFGSSFVSDSPLEFHLLRDDTLQEQTPPNLGLLVSEREQNTEDASLLHVDMVNVSSNILPANSAEITSHEARRNSRRLFWDALSRASSGRHTDSSAFAFSPVDLRTHDRRLIGFSGGFLNDEVGGDLSSQGNRTPSNEQRLNSRFEILERLRGTLDSTHYLTGACPRGIHTDGSCSCYSSSSAEEAGARTGISRMIMLAEAWFEVLDQIRQQPMPISLSMISLPAQESVVDSFPVKIHKKSEKLESADDVSQCYICLAEYEEGDKIRVLPCHHEYHVSCVDKWLKEIHGVCPLCRGDVSEGSTDCSF